MKKRLFAAILSVLMVLPQTAFYVSAQGAEPTETGSVLLLEEKFETGSPADGTSIYDYNQSAWTQTLNGYDDGTANSVNTIKDVSGNKVASIERTVMDIADASKGYTSYSMKTDLKALDAETKAKTDLVIIDFRLRAMNANTNGLEVGIFDSTKSDTVYFFMKRNHVWGDYDGYIRDRSVSYNPVGEWNDIKIVMDYATGEEKIYVNGVLCVDDDSEAFTNGITGLPVAIKFGTPRIAGDKGGQKDATSSAEFQIDEIVVKAYQGSLAYSSPANGEEEVDVAADKIDLIFNHEITDATNAAFVLDSQEATQIPSVTQATFDSVNKRKVTLTLSGSFDYKKKYTLLSTGAKNAYSKEMPFQIEFTTRERKFMINSPEFTIGGASIDAIANGTVKAKIRIDNEFTSEKPLTVVAASFGANAQLKDADYTVTSVDGENYIEPELTVDAEASGKISLLILDSFSALNPVIGEYVFDSQGLSAPSAITAASATSISAAVDYDGSGEVTLSGDAGEGSIAALVLKPNFAISDLTETNRASASSMIEYIGLTEGTSYTKTYVPRTPVDNLNNYNAYVSGVSTPVSFRVFDAATVTNVLNAVKNSTKETLCDMLKTENPTLLEGNLNINDVLALNLTDYYTLTEPQLVTNELAGQTFAKVSDLRTRYNEVLAEKLEYERDGKEIVTAVNDAVWDDLQLLLENNDSVLTLDWTGDYQNINDKDTFYKKLASDYTFTTEGTTVTKALQNIRDTFSALAKTVLDGETDDTNDEEEYYSPGGGGGGGGGKTIKLPVQTVVPPENNEESDTVSFNDIGDVAWAEVAINALAKEKIINGVGNGRFEPNATVTREQFVKMLVLALELPMEFSDAPFVDVTASDWFYYYVHTAYKNGIVQGASSFGAGRAISRAEMAAMCYRAAQATDMKLDGSADLDFADSSSIPDYAKEAVAALSKSGIINGMGDNTFAPDDSSSRAQAAKIIYGIMQLKGVMD